MFDLHEKENERMRKSGKERLGERKTGGHNQCNVDDPRHCIFFLQNDRTFYSSFFVFFPLQQSQRTPLSLSRLCELSECFDDGRRS